MYTIPPAAPVVPVVSAGVLGIQVLPNTGAPALLVPALVGASLLLGGVVLLIRVLPGAASSWLLRCLAAGLVGGFAAAALASGPVDSGWAVVGLLVGVLTLCYSALAVRSLLPAARRAEG